MAPLLDKGDLNGFFIAIEGIDGAGKTTQANLLEKRLEDSGYDAVVFHEPTIGEWGRKVALLSQHGRTVTPEEEFGFFYEDRKEDVEHNILPALREGKIVIMDRYYYSNMAYQGAKGIDPLLIERKNLQVAPKPNITFILDITAQTAKKRITYVRNDKLNHFEQSLTTVRNIFLKLVKSHPEIKVIDGEQGLDDVREQIFSAVQKMIPQNEGRILRSPSV
ncbi:MAG: dTMP kinase [Nitrososphaerales archaeon]